MSVNCPHCEYDRNPDNSKFCMVCGCELETATPEPTPVIDIYPPNSQPREPEPISSTDHYTFESQPTYTEANPVIDIYPPNSEPNPVIDIYPPNSEPTPVIDIYPPNSEPNYSNFNSASATQVTQTDVVGETAKLLPKQTNAPISEFTLNESNLLVGRFDPETGPVDVDLEGFVGEETVSRQHAEIYQERGEWKIKDIGSTNGVFIKRSGQTRFSSRITMPESIYPGDEIALGKVRLLFKISQG